MTRSGRLAAVACAALVSAALLGVNLDGHPLLDPDEAKHAEVAREMLVTGRVLEPVINFEPYHHKPVLFYLLVGLGYRAFGVSELGARCVPALAAWLTVVLVCAWAGRRDWREGLVAAGLLGTCAFFVETGRFTNLDVLWTLCLSAAVLSIASLIEHPERTRHAYAFYVLVALAVLVKGPAAVVLAAVPVGLALWRGDLEVRELAPVSGPALAALIIGAWLVPTLIVAPSYVVDFFLVHNVERYLAEASADVFHPEPFWFFVPVLAAALLPWSPLLPMVLGSALFARGWRRFLAEYCVWIVCFFSLSSGKLATYVLPAFPVLAILTADRLRIDAAEEPFAGRVAASLGAGVCALAIVAAYGALRTYAHGLEHLAWLLAPLSLAGVAVVLAGRRITTMRALAITCAGMALTLVLVAARGSHAIGQYVSDKDLALAAREHGAPRRVIAYRVRPFSFQFYTGWPLVYHVPIDDVRRALYEPGATLVLTEERWTQHLEDVAPGIELRALRQNRRHVLYTVVAPWSEDPSQGRLPTDSRLLR